MISIVIIPLISYFGNSATGFLPLFDTYKDTNTNPLIRLTSPGRNDESNRLLRSPGCEGKE